MSYTNRESALSRIRGYIELVCSGNMPVDQFCENFEIVYVREMIGQVSSVEVGGALDALYQVVIRYSPFPDERERLRYLGDDEVVSAAEVARVRLSDADDSSRAGC